MPFWVSIRDTGTSVGRGVFAERSFDVGEVVESSPVVLIEEELKAIPEPVRRLLFNWPGDTYALVLGYGSIYNHADDPNLEFGRNIENQTVTFSALRKIERDEQLTINYNQVTPGDQPKGKDWFKANQIEKRDV